MTHPTSMNSTHGIARVFLLGLGLSQALLLVQLVLPPLPTSLAFSSIRQDYRTPLVSLRAIQSEDFPPPEEDAEVSSVDWDAEWKKVMEKERAGLQESRPGKDFYKSEAQLAAIRAANQATNQINKAAENIQVPAIPSWRSLQGDWKFWIGVLVIISFGSALIAAGGIDATSVNPTTPDAYYI